VERGQLDRGQRALQPRQEVKAGFFAEIVTNRARGASQGFVIFALMRRRRFRA
jgi:hypothetical protein